MAFKLIDYKHDMRPLHIPASDLSPQQNELKYGVFGEIGSIWTCYPIESEMQARLELLVNELTRLHYPAQPRAILATDYDNGQFYILHETNSSRQRLPKYCQNQFYSGNYRGLGFLVVLAIFFQKINLNPETNLYLDQHNQIINLLNSGGFISIEELGSNGSLKRKITPNLIESLPFVSNYEAVCWFDNHSDYLPSNMSNGVSFRSEASQAILQLILMPDELIQWIVESFIPSSLAAHYYHFLCQRRDQLLYSALQCSWFQLVIISFNAGTIIKLLIERLTTDLAMPPDRLQESIAKIKTTYNKLYQAHLTHGLMPNSFYKLTWPSMSQALLRSFLAEEMNSLTPEEYTNLAFLFDAENYQQAPNKTIKMAASLLASQKGIIAEPLALFNITGRFDKSVNKIGCLIMHTYLLSLSRPLRAIAIAILAQVSGYDFLMLVSMYPDHHKPYTYQELFVKADHLGFNNLMRSLISAPLATGTLLSAIKKYATPEQKFNIFSNITSYGHNALMLAILYQPEHIQSMIDIIHELPSEQINAIIFSSDLKGKSILYLAKAHCSNHPSYYNLARFITFRAQKPQLSQPLGIFHSNKRTTSESSSATVDLTPPEPKRLHTIASTSSSNGDLDDRFGFNLPF